MNNRINFVLAQGAIDNINKALDTIDLNLNLLIALGPGESRGLQSIDSGRYLFVKKCFEALDTNPEFKPDFYNPDDYKRDYILYNQLGPFDSRINNLCRKITDTRIVAGHESYTFSRAMYEKIQSGSKKGVPGFKSMYDDLKPFFERMGNKKKDSVLKKKSINLNSEEL